MTQRNFDRQMWALEALERCESGYEITEFHVEEWAGNHVNVTLKREILRPETPEGRLKIAYHESFVVGPRGAVKKLYSSLY